MVAAEQFPEPAEPAGPAEPAESAVMNISEPFIRRPIATSLLAVGLMLTGMVAYRFLPVAPLPQVDFPTINVSANYSGVDPATAATSLAAPLERRFANIAGVSEITSVSQLNGTRITLQFDLSRDINGAARDVQAAINAASSELPPGLPSPPNYRKANPNDTPVLILALTSDTVPLSQIYNQAEELLVPAMSQIPGVSEVDVGGGAKSAVRIQVDPAALASMGLSIDNVRTVLQGQNKDEPKGSIDGDRISFTMNASDQLFTANRLQKPYHRREKWRSHSIERGRPCDRCDGGQASSRLVQFQASRRDVRS